MKPRRRTPVSLRVTNTSRVALTRSSDSGIVLSATWLDPDGRIVAADVSTAPLMEPLRPGETVTLTLVVEAPARRGSYLLEVDLVEQGVCRFKEKGVRSGYTPVSVCWFGGTPPSLRPVRTIV